FTCYMRCLGWDGLGCYGFMVVEMEAVHRLSLHTLHTLVSCFVLIMVFLHSSVWFHLHLQYDEGVVRFKDLGDPGGKLRRQAHNLHSLIDITNQYISPSLPYGWENVRDRRWDMGETFQSLFPVSITGTKHFR